MADALVVVAKVSGPDSSAWNAVADCWDTVETEWLRCLEQLDDSRQQPLPRGPQGVCDRPGIAQLIP